MPTPFYHLSIADTLLKDSQLEPALRQFLRAQRPAFLLGHTAPDVQTISGQARRETHFFELPVERHQTPPWEKILRLFPDLEAQALQKPARTAFIAGYLCHLQADWLWILELFAPVFGPDQTWAAKSQRYFYHNVLRAYLDEQIISTLPHTTGRTLLHVIPAYQLPFAHDYDLQQWRDFLANQLYPQFNVRTVEVFAARQGIPAQHYHQLLNSEERLEAELFSRLPRQALIDYRAAVVSANHTLLQAYFAGSLAA